MPSLSSTKYEINRRPNHNANLAAEKLNQFAFLCGRMTDRCTIVLASSSIDIWRISVIINNYGWQKGEQHYLWWIKECNQCDYFQFEIVRVSRELPTTRKRREHKHNCHLYRMFWYLMFWYPAIMTIHSLTGHVIFEWNYIGVMRFYSNPVNCKSSRHFPIAWDFLQQMPNFHF